MTTWQPGQSVPDGYGIEVLEDGTERLVASWPTSPGSEPIEEDDEPKGIAILCETCFDNGNWDGMWPSDHDDDPTWGVATVEAGDDGEWDVTWLATGLTLDQAHEHLERIDLPGGYRLMS